MFRYRQSSLSGSGGVLKILLKSLSVGRSGGFPKGWNTERLSYLQNIEYKKVVGSSHPRRC